MVLEALLPQSFSKNSDARLRNYTANLMARSLGVTQSQSLKILLLCFKTVHEAGASFGIAQDGDADRAIFVDENGTYIWGDKSLSLVGKYITGKKKGRRCRHTSNHLYVFRRCDTRERRACHLHQSWIPYCRPGDEGKKCGVWRRRKRWSHLS